jgi:hypothetical protein
VVGGRRLVPELAVCEADGRLAVALGELDLDQLLDLLALELVVPEPGEGEPRRRLDRGVAAAAAVGLVLVRVSHHDPELAADPQVDPRLGRLPVVSGVPPAAHDLLVRERVEDALGGRGEGALDGQRLAVVHPFILARTRIRTHARITSRPPVPPASGTSSSTGMPETWAITRRRRGSG